MHLIYILIDKSTALLDRLEIANYLNCALITTVLLLTRVPIMTDFFVRDFKSNLILAMILNFLVLTS
jgi:hypothetical protein